MRSLLAQISSAGTVMLGIRSARSARRSRTHPGVSVDPHVVPPRSATFNPPEVATRTLGRNIIGSSP
jgi:hypothetical protein